MRVLGPCRIVASFDPDHDDPQLLRTIVMLLRTVAIAATAEEKIAEALSQLDKINTVKKLASGIQKNASKIDSECAGIRAAIERLLNLALSALGGAASANATDDFAAGAA